MHEFVWCVGCGDWIDPLKSSRVTVPGIRVPTGRAASFHETCYRDHVDPSAPSTPGCTGAMKPGHAMKFHSPEKIGPRKRAAIASYILKADVSAGRSVDVDSTEERYVEDD